jgi:hypothetical protein
MAKVDGGQAFPQMAAHGHKDYESGMSLLDYFAGQALVALGNWAPRAQAGEVVATRGLDGTVSTKWPGPDELKRLRAEWAYQQAAAMLEERKRMAPE